MVSGRTLSGFFLAFFFLWGCGDDSLPYEGITGQPQPITLVGDVPFIDGQVLASGENLLQGGFIIDTGSPLSVLSQHAVPNGTPGWRRIGLQAGGLSFPGLDSAIIELFGPTDCATPAPVGLIGADVMRHFTLELDHRKGTVTFHDDDPPALTAPSAPVNTIPLQISGGGSVTLPGLTGGQSVPATRLLLEIEIDGKKVMAMIDTGATGTVVRRGILPSNPARPQACCLEVNTTAGGRSVKIVRLQTLRIASIVQKQGWALELDDDKLFDDLSAETKKQVDVLIGGNTLRSFTSWIDYRGGTLSLLKDPLATEQANEWLLPGFTSCKAQDKTFVVLDVFDNGPAAAHDIKSGTRLIEVNGESVLPLDERALLALIRRDGAGAAVTLTFDDGDGARDVELTIDHALAHFP